MFYLFIKNGKINGGGESRLLNEDILSVVVSEELFLKYIEEPSKFIWDGENVILNPNYETEQAAKKEEQIKMLKMTRGDLFEYTIMSKGLDETDIRALIEQDETLDAVTKKLYLNRLDNALYFYRGHPAVDFIGDKLGLSKEELDALFEEKNAVE